MKRRPTIEEELGNVRIKSTQEESLDTPNKLIKYYIERHELRSELEAASRNIKPEMSTWANNWNTIQLMLGVVYRIQTDGYNILEMIGTPPETVAEFSRSALRIRELSLAFRETGGTTPTKMLYDQIKQLG